MKKILLTLMTLWLILTSCGASSQSSNSDIINPEADFLYFYSWSCWHCQELNKEMEAEDIYSQLAIEKREVSANNTNRELFIQTAEWLGVSESDMGVPFALNKHTQEYVVGVQPAMEMFREAIANPIEKNTDQPLPPTHSGTVIE